MIKLDFKVDEQELALNLMYDLTLYSASLFEVTIFMMPVRFSIHGTEVFEFEDDVWFEVPIMGVASSGLESLLRAKRWGKCDYDTLCDAGTIKFTMIDNDHVEVFYNGLDIEIRQVVNYDELLKAFHDFANKVRAFLWKRVPQMNEHPYWGPWLRGEREY